MTDLNFVDLNEKIPRTASPNQESSLNKAAKSKHGPVSRQYDFQVGNLENKPASSQDWQSLATFFLKYKELREEIMEMFSNKKKLWGGRLGTINSSHHTIKLKKAACPNG